MAQNVRPIQIDEATLEYEVKQMLPVFEKKEAEETWESHENAVFKLTAIIRGSSQLSNLIPAIRKLKNGILSAIATDRTRLCRAALLLIEEMGRSLGTRFESLVDIFTPSVLKIATRANKVFVSSSAQCIHVLVEHTKCISLIPYLVDSLQNPSKTLRTTAIEALLLFFQTNSLGRAESTVEAYETAIRIGVVDPTPSVRETSRKIFVAFQEQYPQRVDRFTMTLNDTMKKYLKVSSNNTAAIPPRPVTRQKSQRFAKEPETLPPPVPIVRSRSQRRPEEVTTQSSNQRNETQQPTRDENISRYGNRLRVENEHEEYIQQINNSNNQQTFRKKPVEAPSGISVNSGWLSSGKLQKATRVQATNEQTQSQNPISTLYNAITNINRAKTLRPVPSSDNFGYSGPQRVRAPSVTEIAPPAMKKALRVPSRAELRPPRKSAISPTREPLDTSFVNDSRKAEKKRRQTTVGIAPSYHDDIQHSNIPPRPLHEASQSYYAHSTYSWSSTSEPPLLDLPEITKMIKNSEWSIRVDGFAALGRYASEVNNDLRSKLTKIGDLFAFGFQDSHMKVVQAAAIALQESVPRFAQYHNHLDQATCQRFLDQVVPLLASAVFQPNTMRTKQNLFETGIGVVEMVRQQFSGEPLISALSASLNNPEWAQNVRVKQGVLMFMSDLTTEEWNPFTVKLSNMRSILTRLAAVSGDKLDVLSQKHMRGTIATLHLSNSENFWNVWPNLKPTDRSNINKVFDTPDIFRNTKVLFDAIGNKVSPARSASPSRPSSPGRNSSPMRSPFGMTRSVSPSLRAANISSRRTHTAPNPSQGGRSPLARNAGIPGYSSAKSSPLASPREYRDRSPSRISVSSSTSSTSANVSRPTMQYIPGFGTTMSEGPSARAYSSQPARTPPRMPASLTLVVDSAHDSPKKPQEAVQESAMSDKSDVSDILPASFVGRNGKVKLPNESESVEVSNNLNGEDEEEAERGRSQKNNETFTEEPPRGRTLSRRGNRLSGKQRTSDIMPTISDGTERRVSGVLSSGQKSIPASYRESYDAGLTYPDGTKLNELPAILDETLPRNAAFLDETLPRKYTPNEASTINSNSFRPQTPPFSPPKSVNNNIPGGNHSLLPMPKSSPKNPFEKLAQTPEIMRVQSRNTNREIYSWDERAIPDPKDLKVMLQNAEKAVGEMGVHEHFLNPEILNGVPCAAEEPDFKPVAKSVLELSEVAVTGLDDVSQIGIDFEDLQISHIELAPSPAKPVKEIGEAEVMTHEDVARVVASSSSRAKTLEDILDVARRRRTSLWGNKAGDLVTAVVDSLKEMDEKQSASSVQKSLILLRELIVHQTSSVSSQAGEVLLAVLQSANFSGSAEDILEVAYEIDALLEAFVQNLTPEAVRDAVVATLNANVGHRVCFAMLIQLVPTGVLDNYVSWNLMDPDFDNGQQAPTLVYHIAKGLESKKAGTRKSAYDCTVALTRRLGKDFAELLLMCVKNEEGSKRESLIRTMLDNEFPGL